MWNGKHGGNHTYNEEEDEEHSGSLTCLVGRAHILSLQCRFKDKRDEYSSNPCEHELSTSKPVNEQCSEDIAEERERDPHESSNSGI